MKQTLFTILLTLLGVLAVERGFAAYRWKHYTDERTYYAQQAAGYLFGPSGVTTADGHPMTRQQLIDQLLQRSVAASGGSLKLVK